MSDIGKHVNLIPAASQLPVDWYFDQQRFDLEKKLAAGGQEGARAGKRPNGEGVVLPTHDLGIGCEPDRIAASTTKVPSPKAAINRLRCGKLAANGGVPKGYSLINTPCAMTSCANT